ncbi:hypothetical protein LTR62_005855 [Meristemomyces frigidus]|uniref:ADP-ribose 1''-phosphate phosphatase n=1 Tax=Meristemomyces frigidus TaxID=1508187 RepID=A0AAN7TP02_9PEZI|nr:hypothetical protein LTR62_005855 [Meristemomyces frigidus]
MAPATLDTWVRKANTGAKRKSENAHDGPQQRPLKRVDARSSPEAREIFQLETSTDDTSQPATEHHPEHTLKIKEATGDIFAAPPNTLLIHACNCQGSWSAGIAQAFHNLYPSAYTKYAAHCKTTKQKATLVGTGLLIAQPSSTKASMTAVNTTSKSTGIRKPAGKVEAKHFVGCLFTSSRYGRAKDTPAQILDATGPAMKDLLRQVKEWNATAGDEDKVGEVRICQINSGLFNVLWAKTRAVLETIDVDGGDIQEITVFVRDE